MFRLKYGVPVVHRGIRIILDAAEGHVRNQVERDLSDGLRCGMSIPSVVRLTRFGYSG